MSDDRYKWIHANSFGIIVKDIWAPLVENWGPPPSMGVFSPALPIHPGTNKPLSSYRFDAIDYGYGKAFNTAMASLPYHCIGTYPYIKIDKVYERAAATTRSLLDSRVMKQKEIKVIAKLRKHEQ